MRVSCAKIEDMVGKTFFTVEVRRTEVDDASFDQLRFTEENGDTFVFYHSQDCCETVYIEEIIGDLRDLAREPLLQAEKSISSSRNKNSEPPLDDDYSYTWTFYKFATIKGSVTVRWYGTSNGYYSESVNLCKETADV